MFFLIVFFEFSKAPELKYSRLLINLLTAVAIFSALISSTNIPELLFLTISLGP